MSPAQQAALARARRANIGGRGARRDRVEICREAILLGVATRALAPLRVFLLGSRIRDSTR
jgi:hypothetical protein